MGLRLEGLPGASHTFFLWHSQQHLLNSKMDKLTCSFPSTVTNFLQKQKQKRKRWLYIWQYQISMGDVHFILLYGKLSKIDLVQFLQYTSLTGTTHELVWANSSSKQFCTKKLSSCYVEDFFPSYFTKYFLFFMV